MVGAGSAREWLLLSAPGSIFTPFAPLLTARAVRERCQGLYELALDGRLEHFQLHPDWIDACTDYVIETTRAAYPDFRVPLHSRWRHFAVAGIDRWEQFRAAHPQYDTETLSRIGIDLAVVSVLLDAGAGPEWCFADPQTGANLGRSEGLALASLAMFLDGGFSSDPARPHQADAAGLAGLSEARLRRGFQVADGNSLTGMPARAQLLKRLGRVLGERFDSDGQKPPRVSALLDRIRSKHPAGRVPATVLLEQALTTFREIWPRAMVVSGQPLGDVGRHSRAGGEGLTAGLVPFHKLSQWLCYSLIEPLSWGGIAVVDLDGLTGLPEYRNGGLFIDTGVLEPNPEVRAVAHAVDAEPIVEWRALTVCLLDEVTRRMRAKLGLDAAALPLASVLQGGTWAAGRRMARERRADGSPPLDVRSEGTVF